MRIGRPATAMLKADIPKSALKGAPEGALGNRGAQGSALEGALEPNGCSVRMLFILFSHIEHPVKHLAEHLLGSRAPSRAPP